MVRTAAEQARLERLLADSTIRQAVNAITLHGGKTIENAEVGQVQHVVQRVVESVGGPHLGPADASALAEFIRDTRPGELILRDFS